MSEYQVFFTPLPTNRKYYENRKIMHSLKQLCYYTESCPICACNKWVREIFLGLNKKLTFKNVVGEKQNRKFILI
jgi:hypothetical protein